MRPWMGFPVVWGWAVLCLVGFGWLGASTIHKGSQVEILACLFWWGTGIVVMAYGVHWLEPRLPHPPRAKPEGYIGRFRRPDGTVVHVARLETRNLMVISDDQPPQDLGTVTGPELAHWEKVATTPD
jgi:hypothetical protein